MNPSTVDIQDSTSPDYVDPIKLINLAKLHDIQITEQFIEANTPGRRVALRNWLNAEIERRQRRTQ